eukprot:7716570-Pyramimonas_sp.AAC.1
MSYLALFRTASLLGVKRSGVDLDSKAGRAGAPTTPLGRAREQWADVLPPVGEQVPQSSEGDPKVDPPHPAVQALPAPHGHPHP